MAKGNREIIIIYVEKMNIGKNDKSLVLRALQDDQTKSAEKLVENAYRYALLLETNITSNKRMDQACRRVVESCERYSKDIQVDNCK